MRGRGQDQLVTPWCLDFVAHRPEIELCDGLMGRERVKKRETCVNCTTETVDQRQTKDKVLADY